MGVYCPKCGEDIPDDARFCTKCGHQIDSSKEEGPTDAELWLSKAKALKEEGIAKDDKGKIEESLAAFDKAIELDPKSGALWYEKGVALGLLERFEEALENFETALKLDPENETYKTMLENAKESIAAKQKKEEETRAKEMPSIAMEIKAPKELKEFEVIGVIESLMGRTAYQSLKALEEDVIKRLKKEGYILKDKELHLIKDTVIKHGHTGKFAIDDMIARKFGGGKRAALLVTIVLFLGVAIFTEILLPMMSEKLMNEPPVAQITSPDNNIVLTAGQAVLLSGTAKDKEDDKILGSNFVWSSDIDGELGTGSSISKSALSPGKHTITLTVIDSKGAQDIESVVITIQEREILHELKLQKTVTVSGREEDAYIRVWEPLIDEGAPNKGWLEMENPFYSIKVNLDHSYYLLYDKALGKDLLIYNDKVENPMDMLTGSDIGYGDLDGNNQVPKSTTALHDTDGVGRHTILYEDKNSGFLLVDTEGWDFQVVDPNKGYDAESEVMFGLFADKPYFIDATEVNNLQTQGVARPNDLKNPNTVLKSWVLTGEYDSASIKGGDSEHLNKIVYEPFYEVQSLTGEGRKPWHAGSAEISKMFPDHVLVGNRLGGAVIFSLPQGKFRWDDELDVFGGQVVAEFLIGVERPQKAVAFTTNTVSRESFLYDARDYATITGYAESLGEICARYEIGCIGTIDAKDYEVKRFAYVITLTSEWYDASTNKVKEGTWNNADSALDEFKRYENIIYQQLRSTKPLFA